MDENYSNVTFSLLLAQKKKKEAEDRKKIQLFKEFLNNIQSEYAMIYLTLICLNLSLTFGVKMYVGQKIGHFRRISRLFPVISGDHI